MTDPSSVKVGPYVYEIRWDELKPKDADDAPFRWDERWGYTDNTHAVIYVHPDAHQVLRRMILMHEILHCCAFVSGHMFEGELNEEDWVLRVTPQLLKVFQDNEKLFRWLIEAP